MTADEFGDLVEFHYCDGPFRGFDVLGYVGHEQRSYVTDAWVVDAATALGWSLVEVDEWMCSAWGRWALDAAPMSAEEMRREMARCDVAALLDEVLT